MNKYILTRLKIDDDSSSITPCNIDSLIIPKDESDEMLKKLEVDNETVYVRLSPVITLMIPFKMVESFVNKIREAVK
jgi:hypothetical protein